MKRKVSIGSLFILLALFQISCGKDPQIASSFTSKENGLLSLSLGATGSFEVIAKSSNEIDINEFQVRIYGTTLRNSSFDTLWNRYGDMSPIISIPAGEYTLEAYNGSQHTGFDSPFYFGNRKFKIGIQELTEAQVTCILACVKVNIEFTPLFLSNVNDPICIVHSNDGAILEFSPLTQGAGYIATPADGQLGITVRGKYIEDNTMINKTYYINDISSKQWHRIALSVNTAASIKGEGLVKVDHKVDEKNSTVLIPGKDDIIDNNGDNGSWDDDDPVNPDIPGTDNKPTIEGSNFNNNPFTFQAPLEIPEAQKDGVTLNINLTAPEGGIQHLYLNMTSTDPIMNGIFDGLGATNINQPWDLANPETLSEEALSILTSMDVIDTSDPVKNKTSYLFQIGKFMSFLTAPSETGTYYDHTFTIKIVDNKGNSTSEQLVIRRKP